MTNSDASIGAPLSRPLLSSEITKDQRNRRFVEVNGKGKTYEGIDFSYSLFERAYFKSATFKNCNFTGARFIECNFRSAKFIICDLEYIDFHRTLMDAREAVANLPKAPNQRRDALQNLRANAVSIGDFDALGMLTLAQVAASHEHYRQAAFGSDSYYRQKYSTLWQRIQAAIQLVALTIGGIIWGHGERPANIALSLFAILLTLSLINFWAVLPYRSWSETGYGIQIFRYVLELFLGLGTDNRFGGFLWVDYLLAFIRYVYVGVFVAILFKSISHR